MKVHTVEDAGGVLLAVAKTRKEANELAESIELDEPAITPSVRERWTEEMAFKRRDEVFAMLFNDFVHSSVAKDPRFQELINRLCSDDE